jgi:hypothetical protein
MFCDFISLIPAKCRSNSMILYFAAVVILCICLSWGIRIVKALVGWKKNHVAVRHFCNPSDGNVGVQCFGHWLCFHRQGLVVRYITAPPSYFVIHNYPLARSHLTYAVEKAVPNRFVCLSWAQMFSLWLCQPDGCVCRLIWWKSGRNIYEDCLCIQFHGLCL